MNVLVWQLLPEEVQFFSISDSLFEKLQPYQNFMVGGEEEREGILEILEEYNFFQQSEHEEYGTLAADELLDLGKVNIITLGFYL